MILRHLLLGLVFSLFSFAIVAQPVIESSVIRISERFVEYSIHDVMQILTANYGVNFAYSSGLNIQKKVNLELDKVSLEEALDAIFKKISIDYRITTPTQVLLRSFVSAKPAGKELPDGINTIHGTIISSSGEALENVAVYFPGSTVGSFTTDQGSFVLSFPEQYINKALNVSLIGYKKVKINPVFFTQNEYLVLDYESLIIPEISILSSSPRLIIQNKKQYFKVKENVLQSSISTPAGQDIFRNLQLLAGVSAHNDDSAELIIRGSDQENNMLVLDGIPIYNAQHYYGIFSGINANYASEVQLYKNAIPIDYGGKIGGLVLINSPEELRRDPEIKADISLLTASVNSILPISKKLNFHFAARSTLTNVADNNLFDFADNGDQVENFTNQGGFRNRIIQNIPDFSFSDFNGKLVYEGSDNHNFSVNVFRSHDHYDNSFTNNFSVPTQNGQFRYNESFSDNEKWMNTGFSLVDQFYTGKNISIDSRLYYSKYENSHYLNGTLNRRLNNQSVENGFEISEQNLIEKSGGHIKTIVSTSNGGFLHAGIFAEQNHINYSINNSGGTLLQGDDDSFVGGIFWEYNQQLKDFYLSVGTRNSYFKTTNKAYISPRILLNQKLSPRFSLKSSFDISQQFETQLSYENRLGQTIQIWLLSNGENIPVRTSTNFMIGGTYIFDLFSIDVELYKSNINNILEFALNRPGIGNPDESINSNDYKLFKGEAESYGMDITLKMQRNIYQGWIAYTLGKVNNFFPQVFKGQGFPDENDRRHQFKWVNSFSLGNWNLSGNFIYSSGKPYINFSALDRKNDRQNLSPDEKISRLPAYSRIDAGIDYDFSIGSSKMNFGFSVYNIINRQNVKYVQYIYSVPTLNPDDNKLVNTVLGAESNLLDRTFNFNLKISL